MNDFSLPQPRNFQYATAPEQREATWRETAAAAFRQENDVYNAIELVRNRNRPAPDPEFDFLAAAKQSRFWNSHSSKLARAQSLAELRQIELKIAQEEEDRALLASQGAAGFAWAMAAGVASPTIAIPLVGQARGALGAGQAFALAGAAAVAQEAPLFANQLTRTGVESGIAIAGGTVLGGILGSTAVYFRGRELDRIAAGIGPGAHTPRPLIPGGGGKIDAPDAPEITLPGDVPPNPVRFKLDTEGRKILTDILQKDGIEGLEAQLDKLPQMPGLREVAERLVSLYKKAPQGPKPLDELWTGEFTEDGLTDFIQLLAKDKDLALKDAERLIEEYRGRIPVVEQPKVEPPAEPEPPAVQFIADPYVGDLFDVMPATQDEAIKKLYVAQDIGLIDQDGVRGLLRDIYRYYEGNIPLPTRQAGRYADQLSAFQAQIIKNPPATAEEFLQLVASDPRFTAADKRSVMRDTSIMLKDPFEAMLAREGASLFRQDTRPVAKGDIVTDAGVSSKTAKIFDRLRKTFGMDETIRIVSVDDMLARPAEYVAKYGKNFTASQGLRGFYIQQNGEYIFAIKESLPTAAKLEIIYHEFGHLLQFRYMARATDEQKMALFTEYANLRRAGRNNTSAVQFYHNSMGPAMQRYNRKLGQLKYTDTQLAADYRVYARSFDEWFANKVSQAVATNEIGQGIVADFFRSVAELWRKITAQFRKQVPAGAVDEWLARQDFTLDTPSIWASREAVATRSESIVTIDEMLDKAIGSTPQGRRTLAAKVRGDQFKPLRTVINEDGTVTYEPFVDADGVVDPGAMAPATFIGRFAAITSPILRAINQYDQPVKAPQTRRIFQQLSDSGVAMEGNKSGIATTAEGTVEHRLGYYSGLLGNFYRLQHEAYLEYVFEGTPNAAQRLASNVMIETGRAPKGKLTFVEFKEQVADAANLGDKSDIPQVTKAANAVRELYNKVHDAADEAADVTGGRRLYAFFDPRDETQSYMHHQFDPEKVAEFREDFINDVAAHYEKALTGTFNRRVTKALARAEAEAQYADILRLPQEEAQKLYDELTEQLAALRDPSNVQEMVDAIAHVRAEARQVYADELARLEKTNVNEDPTVTRDNRRIARETTKEQVEELRLKADEMEAALPEPVRAGKKERQRLTALKRMVNESMGRLETRQAEKLAKIEANEDANIRNFERVVRGTQRFLKKAAKLSDKAYAEELAKVQRTLELAVKRLDDNERAIERTLKKTEGEPGLFDQTLLELDEKAGKLFDRLKAVEERFAAVKNLDRPAAMAELRAQLDEIIAATNGINSRRSERNARLRQQAKELDPGQVETKIKAMKTRQLLRFEKLEEDLQARGATDINAALGRFDFSEIAREAAVDLQNKIAGINTRVAQIDVMAELRSPMKRRMLNMPYDIKRKYLELDTERLLTRYTRTMGSDIELYRAFGSVDGSTAQRSIIEEFSALKDYLTTRTVDEKGKPIDEARRRKDLIAMDKAQNARLAEFSATIERIRGIRGAPKDPAAMSYRLGRLFLNWNTASLMGSAAITSIPDAARAVVAHGLTRTFRDSWMPFIGSLVDESRKAVNQQQIKQLRLLGIGNDVYTNTRARGTFDISGVDFGSQTKVERFFDFVAAKTPQVALFGPWTDYMKQMTGAATMARFFSSIDDLVKGKITPEDLEYLTQASISPDMARRIQDQMERTGTRYKDTIIPNLEAWNDYGALRAFHAAMSREDARLVITPGLERPLWMDASMLGRIVGQFRSFTMASNTKIVISGLQQRNMAAAYALQGTMFSLALGAISYYIWAMTSGDRARKEMQEAGWEVWMDQALYRSGLLGAFSEVQSIGSEIPLTRPYVSFAEDDLAGRRANSLVGAVAGPTFGKANDIANLLVGIDEPTEATVSQARKLLPWQNVFYLRNALSEVEAGTADLFNLPERRQ